MEIQKKSLIVRPELAAPEVDEYDDIPLSRVVSQNGLEIGTYIQYTL